MTERANILVVGPFPPPVNGVSAITALVVHRLSDAANVRCADVAPKSPVKSLRYHARRIRRTIKALVAMAALARAPSPRLYLACDGGWGMIYSLITVALARVLGLQIFIHHHNYAYIRCHSRLMQTIVAVGGSAASHILLCPTMEAEYRARYPRTGKVIIAANACYTPAAEITRRPPDDGRFRIGLLSNLGPTKGLLEFFAVLEQAEHRGLPITGILAGPPLSPRDADIIERKRRKFGDRLIYRGAVFGQEKDAFFADIDAFVFPTHGEAQPNVVFEAMAHGVPVIAFGHGCIPGDLAESGGLSVIPGSDFPSQALAQIEAWRHDSESYRCAQDASHRRGAALRQAATSQFDRLIQAICGQ